MGFCGCTIDADDAHFLRIFQESFGRQLLPNPQPRSIALPAREAIEASLAGTIACRHIAPGRSGADLPPDAVNDATMVAIRMPGFAAMMRRQERFKPLPLYVC